jgi:TRAP-type transport system periplasmic protein
VTAFERQTVRAFDAKALEELKAKGMQVTTLPEAEMAKLWERTKAVWTKFTKEFGEAGAEEMMTALKQVRGSK